MRNNHLEGTKVKIHEYQAKQLMAEFGIPVPESHVADTVDKGVKLAEQIFSAGATRVFIKAQVHAGGRGKAGGIASAVNVTEAKTEIQRILGMTLVSPQTGPEGRLVKRIAVVDGTASVSKELYLSIILDREHECPVILASSEGGVEIEELAESHPEAIKKVYVDPAIGLRSYQARNMAMDLGVNSQTARHLAKVITAACRLFIEKDCAQLEINPLAVMEDDTIVALDAKMSFDESAFYRHPDLASLRDPNEESELEIRASKHDLNYVKLDGEIGCMVNGAGLAMATMDIIHYYGGEPANFLDVGGGASRETVSEAFKILLEDTNVRAVLINIFGGIVRCDRVAGGVIEAVKEIDLDRPLVVRLAGTNAAEGLAMLKESGLKLETASSFSEAAKRVVELSRGGDRL